MSDKILASNSNQQEITVALYHPSEKENWDDFVSSSKNGVFLFHRDYMEYHSDRFVDHSLLFYQKNRLVGVLPANLENTTLHSHGGLTFGGVISAYTMKTPLMLNIFKALIQYCKNVGIKEVVYKPIPYIYQSIPSDEDLYALYVFNGKLMARSVSSCIYMPNLQKFESNRADNIRKAKKNGLKVKESTDFEAFMSIEEESLVKRHSVKPTHTVEEIKMLAKKFPDNIKLFGSFKDDLMLAGIIVFESNNVAHMQYAANSKEGWNIGAQDIIEDYLISCRYHCKRYFDFGISTEKLGQVLNLGLISRKENFGARAITYDLYQIVF